MTARIVAHIIIMARTPNLATCAASCSPSSVRWVQVQPLQPLQLLLPLRPLHPLQLQLQPSHRRCPSALGRAPNCSVVGSRIPQIFKQAAEAMAASPSARFLIKHTYAFRNPYIWISTHFETQKLGYSLPCWGVTAYETTILYELIRIFEFTIPSHRRSQSP